MQNTIKFLILTGGVVLILLQTLMLFFLSIDTSSWFINNQYLSTDLIIICSVAFIIVWKLKLHRRYEFNLGFIFIILSLVMYYLLLDLKSNIYLYFINHKEQIPFEYSKFRFFSDSLVYILLYCGFLMIFSSNLPQLLEEQELEE